MIRYGLVVALLALVAAVALFQGAEPAPACPGVHIVQVQP
jgi:hypothetical protein